ncbi:MAG TPA: hypothetical protein VHS97_22865, partial [Isosphaeraceae bacterium]|nr:hypothetical protein [Isosphaeraceae bacterium]
VEEAVKGFNSANSLVTDALKAQFQALAGITLSNRIRVTGEAERSWLITDPGRSVYLVEELTGPRRLAVSIASLELVATDLTAMITGPNADRFGYDLDARSFFINPVLPDRRQPYREFTIIYHFAGPGAVQAFSQFRNANSSAALTAGNDQFAINYGSAAIGAEILANRLGVGPMGNADAVDLKYEEFFLSSWAVGDPAMVVDVPANARNSAVDATDTGTRVAQKPLFTIDVIDNSLTQAMGNGSGVVPQALKDAFAANGVALAAQAIVTTNIPQVLSTGANPAVKSTPGQWIVLDPFSRNNAPAADRDRYSIVSSALRNEGGKPHMTLTVYKGFPASNVSALTFNSLAHEKDPKIKATQAYYPDDPSNVYHSYIRDHVKFRILHAGPGPSHVHHLHAHQWLHAAGSSNSQYLDSQLIVPGSAYTLEIVHNGSGNRNLTVGDSIFHCHFYPHFAQGMWSLWRSHDVLEAGTWLDAAGRPVTHVIRVNDRDYPVSREANDGKIVLFYQDDQGTRREIADVNQVKRAWNRALPDGEIEAGTPIPALVPLPSLAMPLLPARVRLTDLDPFLTTGSKGQGRRVEVEPTPGSGNGYDNPGYPFFIPGIGGHRPPHPPLDFAWREDANGNRIPAISAQTVGGAPAWGTPPQRKTTELARGIVNPGVAAGTALAFFSSGTGGRAMMGSLLVQAPTSPPEPPATISIDGTVVAGAPTWVVNNNPSAPAVSVVVKPGDNVVWKAGTDNVGVAFATQAEAETVLHFLPGGSLDGGLPRHVVLGGQIVKEYSTRWDFTRDFIAYDKAKRPIAGKLSALHLPEDGTPLEHAAMKHHSTRTHRSYLPDGKLGNITRNGLVAKPGAPYAPPEVDEYGNADFNPRRYQAAVIQTDVVFNKLGWHFPQQRMLTLWEDVADMTGGRRAPQPLFFRSSTNDTIEYWHTNLVPSYYELDDFQVRTPTDVIGQHIHNVKFDVTASDGAANGFNYEDGTFSPDDVRDRISAINRPGGPFGQGGILAFNPRTGFVNSGATPEKLRVVPVHEAYPKRANAGDEQNGLFGKPPLGQDWDGAQTTIQRWDADPLLNDRGMERTLRTIFTHDHLGSSTHQQVGLYAGLVVEPENSLWYLPNGERMNRRADGGPTSWEGFIQTKDPQKSIREFVLEFQDTQLVYNKQSMTVVSGARFDPTASASASASAAFDVGQYGELSGAVGKKNGGSARADIPAFVRILNRDEIPEAFGNLIFPSMGIKLTSKATAHRAKMVPDNHEWVIEEPTDSDLNAGAIYRLVANNDESSLLVYTPGIAPGWSDPKNALNPPGDGNNRTTGAPFPQLVSSGSVGTYTMNYRNEPALARLTGGGGGQLDATDPAFVFSSIPRTDPALNTQPTPGSPINPPPQPPAPTVIEIDGDIVSGTPTWVLKGGGSAANVTVKPGDVIVWKAVTGKHGVVFDTQAVAQAFLDFQQGAGFPVLGPQTVGTETVWGTAPQAGQASGTMLAQATVKAGVAPGTTLGFFCSQHGRAMSGSLATAAAAAAIEIDGSIVNGTPTWVLKGGGSAANVTVKPGDVIVWKAVTGTHGVVFDTQAVAQAFLDFQQGVGIPVLGPQTVGTETVWGT